MSKTYMTRVEGENTRLRHYLARLHRKTLCYSRVPREAQVFHSSSAALSQISNSSYRSINHYQSATPNRLLEGTGAVQLYINLRSRELRM